MRKGRSSSGTMYALGGGVGIGGRVVLVNRWAGRHANSKAHMQGNRLSISRKGSIKVMNTHVRAHSTHKHTCIFT